MSVKTGLASLALLLSCTFAAAAADTAEAKLTEEERQQLLTMLSESAEMYLGLVAGVSDEQWNFKPAPDRWSVGECAEHIMRSNEALFGSAKTALAKAADPDWYEKTKGKSELLMRVMPNRNPGGAGGASAPQEIRPTGEFSRAEIIERFQALYEEARAFVRDTEAPLKEHLEEHPFPIFNPLNAYDWTIYVPLHTIRHSKQMIEVMESDHYPQD